ncbi:hypothetical protein ACFQS2_06975 [Brachybacterium sp. GCM10030267]|uniref:hypothetical protein n=1 Tax=unclassified Brachybacterium TaxID=2623841 RepID=UPI003605D1F9
MPALPADGRESVPSQDEAHQRIRDLLGAVTAAVLEHQPGLTSFEDHRPQRDRSSGGSWRGLETCCHVSALLVSSGVPAEDADGPRRLLGTVDAVAAARGMDRGGERESYAMRAGRWTGGDGDVLEVIVGVRVAVRAISAPFLPGSLDPIASTSPTSPLSPVTPAPRLVR